MDWLLAAALTTAITAVFGTTGVYLKFRPAMKLAEAHALLTASQVEESAEARLWARIAEIEHAVKRERKECDERIARVEKRSAHRDKLRKGEVDLLRHDRNNWRAGLNAMFVMLKRHKDPKLSEIAEMVEEMITRGEQTIAIERAGLEAAYLLEDEETTGEGADDIDIGG